MNLANLFNFNLQGLQGSQGSQDSVTSSEAFFINGPGSGPGNGPGSGPGNGPGPIRPTVQRGINDKPYSRKETKSFRYSVTSDHKPVFMEFSLEGISGPLVALTYNMSFASDLGIAMGSERDFVQRAIDANPHNPRAYWKNAANLVEHFVNIKNPTLMYFQEMNDREKIETVPPFEGGYQALLKLLAKSGTISYNNIRIPYSSQSNPALISYYTTGTYIGTNGQNYGFVAYSIEKQDNTFPTVLTIWNTTILGEFKYFYGNDLGLHASYNLPSHYGRIFSCVTTSKGANLINLHGPNEPVSVNTKLKLVIEKYMKEAATNIEGWNEALTVIGGDTNDTSDAMKKIEYGSTIYNYAGSAPLSCCAENFDIDDDDYNDTLNKPYKSSGDKFLVKNLDSNNPTYKNELFKPIDRRVKYGGRRQSHNLKKRKTIKKKHYKLKKKKSLKKRRSYRRKTRKHTH